MAQAMTWTGRIARIDPADEDERLVRRIAAGDRDALGELYDRYRRWSARSGAPKATASSPK